MKSYEYMKYSYLISDTAFDRIRALATAQQYIQTIRRPRGISDYINSVTLTPTFNDEDMQFIEGSKTYNYPNPINTTGEARLARKLSLSDETRQTLAALGLIYKLYVRQPTDTALISGVLEAWGRGKFTATIDERKKKPLRAYNNYNTIYLTSKQWKWVYKTAIVMQYETPNADLTGNYRKLHRGLGNFIKDFRFVHFEPYPFDPNIENPHPNVPPPANNDELLGFSLKTHPQFQDLFDRTQWCPILPDWYDCLPEPLNPEINTLKAATL